MIFFFHLIHSTKVGLKPFSHRACHPGCPAFATEKTNYTEIPAFRVKYQNFALEINKSTMIQETLTHKEYTQSDTELTIYSLFY